VRENYFLIHIFGKNIFLSTFFSNTCDLSFLLKITKSWAKKYTTKCRFTAYTGTQYSASQGGHMAQINL
jgi:hypothetical protein